MIIIREYRQQDRDWEGPFKSRLTDQSVSNVGVSEQALPNGKAILSVIPNQSQMKMDNSPEYNTRDSKVLNGQVGKLTHFFGSSSNKSESSNNNCSSLEMNYSYDGSINNNFVETTENGAEEQMFISKRNNSRETSTNCNENTS